MKQKLNNKLREHYYRVFKRAINKAHKEGWRDERWPYCDLPWELNCCLSYNELLGDKLFRQHLPESYLKRLDKILKLHGKQLYKKWEKAYDKMMNDIVDEIEEKPKNRIQQWIEDIIDSFNKNRNKK